MQNGLSTQLGIVCIKTALLILLMQRNSAAGLFVVIGAEVVIRVLGTIAPDGQLSARHGKALGGQTAGTLCRISSRWGVTSSPDFQRAAIDSNTASIFVPCPNGGALLLGIAGVYLQSTAVYGQSLTVDSNVGSGLSGLQAIGADGKAAASRKHQIHPVCINAPGIGHFLIIPIRHLTAQNFIHSDAVLSLKQNLHS